jgi:hypothetical protein
VAARPIIPAIRQWLRARGREAAELAARGYRAVRREAGKEKYREYLSDAYGRMRKRYPKVESTAREALDAIGLRPTEPEPDGAAPARRKSAAKKAPARRKTASKKKTGTRAKKAGAKKKKTVTKKKAVAKKKTSPAKKKTAG